MNGKYDAADFWNHTHLGGTSKENPWNYDSDQSTETFVSSLSENPGLVRGDLFISERAPYTVEDKLLKDIKSSARIAYQEELTDEQAQDILDRMRSDIEKTFCKGWL